MVVHGQIPGPMTYESGALPIALRGPAGGWGGRVGGGGGGGGVVGGVGAAGVSEFFLLVLRI